jgi:hypothetical protein
LQQQALKAECSDANGNNTEDEKAHDPDVDVVFSLRMF